jgi:hypothetical protein
MKSSITIRQQHEIKGKPASIQQIAVVAIMV